MAVSMPAHATTELPMPDQPLADSPEPPFAHPVGGDHNVSMHPLQNLSRRVGRLEHRADQVDQRLERIEGRLERVESRLERVEDRLERLEGETHVLKADVAVIKSNYATKTDVANARSSIILWIVSAIFLAQLLPTLPAVLRALEAAR